MITKSFLQKLFTFGLIGICMSAHAKIKLPGMISDGVVLQRDIALPVWGWGAPGENVSITFNGKTYTAKTGTDGKWSLKMLPAKVGGPFEMTVKGTNEIIIKDILVGDVWVCSGQSNMEWRMGSLKEKYAAEIAASSNSNIRQFAVDRKISFTPVDTVDSKGWKPANPDNVLDFSAVAYFFAKDLYAKYKVPIGLIYANWGGTPAEAWISVEGLKQFPNYLAKYNEVSTPEGQEKELNKRMVLLSEWFNKSKTKDKGYPATGKNWTDPTFDDSQWKTMKLPVTIEEAGLPGFDGVVWFRKEIIIPKELAGKDAVLNLSCVDDADSTFFNGKGVGYGINAWAPRKYTIPGSLIKEGKNVIVVRLIDNWSNGGITGNGPMKLTIAGQDIPLDNEWKYQESSRASEFPSYSWDFEYHKFCEPTTMYNSQIVPLIPFAIKGVIWYQGESNADRGYEYRRLFPYMITEWRKNWGQGDFPFLYVQLANFMASQPQPGESNWAELREAQLMTLAIPNTGMAVIIDIGEAGDIHPKNKKDVGSRLALSAQKVAYGDAKVVYSGPAYKSMKVQGNKIILDFDLVGSGLTTKGGDELKQFAIAGADKKFVWAKAKIEGNTIAVWSDAVTVPVAVRYAWADNPEGCNLYNKEGLPASPFRTDSWPINSQSK